MNLMVKKFKSDAKYFMKHNVKVVFSGRRENLRKDVLNSMDYLTDLTKEGYYGYGCITANPEEDHGIEDNYVQDIINSWKYITDDQIEEL